MVTTWPRWRKAAPAEPALPRRVDVFAFPLAVAPPRLAALAAVLSADERERAARFRFAADQQAFVACRGAVREILATWLAIPAAAVRFSYGPHGKPALDGGAHELAFSIAHSGELGLCAVARDITVGVDVELCRELPDALAIAGGHFAPAEHAALAALDDCHRTSAFFATWTRKEAFLKALGEGFSRPLDSFEVAVTPGEAPLLRRVDGPAGPAERWSLSALEPAPGYAAAVVAAGPAPAIATWSWAGE
jgi:4'-phosphopantetheinyl transferase